MNITANSDTVLLIVQENKNLDQQTLKAALWYQQNQKVISQHANSSQHYYNNHSPPQMHRLPIEPSFLSLWDVIALQIIWNPFPIIHSPSIKCSRKNLTKVAHLNLDPKYVYMCVRMCKSKFARNNIRLNHHWAN